jgi:hypothetical protein
LCDGSAENNAARRRCLVNIKETMMAAKKKAKKKTAKKKAAKKK